MWIQVCLVEKDVVSIAGEFGFSEEAAIVSDTITYLSSLENAKKGVIW